MTTLNFFQQLLHQRRHYQALGQTKQALHVLGHLSTCRDLPKATAEDANTCLAELHLKRRRFRKARRHLRAALRTAPDRARLHYLMARAWRANDHGDLKLAAE